MPPAGLRAVPAVLAVATRQAPIMTNCRTCGHSQTLHRDHDGHVHCMWPVVPTPKDPRFCDCKGFVPPPRLVPNLEELQ